MSYDGARLREPMKTPTPVVRVAGESDLLDWQGFVDRTPGAGGLHHAGWYGVLRDAYRVTPYFLIAVNDAGEIEGLLPTYHSRSPLTGSYVSSLEGGVLARSTDTVGPLIAQARTLCEEIGARYLQIRGGMINDPSPIRVHTVHTVLPTSQSADKIWQSMKQSGRRAVRKGMKEKVSVELDPSLTYLEEFYWVYAAHMHALGTPVMGIDAFEAMRRHLGPNRLRLYVVRQHNTLIGGMLCLVNADQWTSYFAATHNSKQAQFANYLLYWHVIRDAAALGIAQFDLGRSTPNSNVHIFKQRWGGADVDVPYYFFSHPGSPPREMGLQKLKTGNGLPQRIWSRLPLALCNRIGPLLRKQLPFI